VATSSAPIRSPALRPTANLIAGSLSAWPLVETFRLLALNLQRLLEGDERKAISVMSAWPGDGRSLVAFCLARALAELTPPVLLVDADPTGSGVDELAGTSHWKEHGHAVGTYPVSQVSVSPDFRVLVPPRNWAKVPRSPIVFVEELNNAIQLAMAEGITVVIDTPACTTSSIPFYMAGTATGILYVARRRVQDGRTHHDIRAQLEMLRARVLGVVFNEG
jgi:Mrp family chromosome partitioning ATPase